MKAEAYFLQTRNGGHRKVSVPRGPTGSCSVSPPLLIYQLHTLLETTVLPSLLQGASDKAQVEADFP